jgi:putative ABC transport system permease protein
MRFGGMFNKGRKDRELQEELESHVQMHVDDNLRAGMTLEEARRQAIIKFGGIESTKEAYREQRGLPLLETLWQDLRYGLRMLRKNPGFTVVAVLTLALGIGANTAIFSVANAALLRPLPCKNPERLAALWATSLEIGSRGQASPLDFVSWRMETQSFAAMAALRPGSVNLTERGEPVELQSGQISSGFFEMLGIAPELGRSFAPEECRLGGARVALLTHALWQQRFGSDPGVVGQNIRLDDQSYLVVGVMPEIRQFPVDNLALWTPLQLNERQPDDRHFLFVLGRLQQGKTIAEAQAAIATIAARLEKEFPDSHAGCGAAVVSLRQSIAGPVRPVLAVLFGAVGCVLLIACANVANLLLAAAGARQREIGIRFALGATRARLSRQLLAESLLLALAGGALGVVLAHYGVGLLLASIPADLPLPSYLQHVGLDVRVLGFALLLSMATGFFFGLLPALRASHANPNSALKEGGRTAGSGFAQSRLRNVLIVAELALTLPLLAGAGLLLQNAVRLQRTDPGLNPGHVLVMNLSLPSAKYQQPAQKIEFFREALERVRALPGVRQAGLVNDLPFRSWTTFNFTIDGQAAPPPGNVPEAGERVASPDYFQAMGIAVRRGRPFTERDGPDNPRVVMVNDALVRRYFPGEDPIGKRIRPGGPSEPGAPWETIIGIVGDVRHFGLDQQAEPEIYNVYAQEPWSAMILVARTEADPMSMARAVKEHIWAVDPNQPISNVTDMVQILSDSLWQTRALALLQATFALAALLMAAAGLYGVIARSVSLRRYEFGVRLALGAQRADILKLVLKQAFVLVLVGSAIGLAGAIAAARVVIVSLHDTTPVDPRIFAVVVALLSAVALLASYLPARRAMKVDPMVALRCE